MKNPESDRSNIDQFLMDRLLDTFLGVVLGSVIVMLLGAIFAPDEVDRQTKKTIVEPVHRVMKCGECGSLLCCPECQAYTSAAPASDEPANFAPSIQRGQP